MDKPWLLTHKEFNNMRGDETALLYLTIQRILRAQHLKTLEWLERARETQHRQGYLAISEELWQQILAQAKKNVGDG